MKILVTGGAGYIGSHTSLVLAEEGHEVIVLDNLENGYQEAINRIEDFLQKPIKFYKGNINDTPKVRNILSTCEIDAVIHFAGLKAVGESSKIPLSYYMNNVSGTLNLLNAMEQENVNKMVFSSSATVYGSLAPFPYKEDFGRGQPSSPYGKTKVIIEDILQDLASSDPKWCFTSLRYFNPIGAHHSGIIGEDPKGLPNNLLPFISQVASGKREKLSVFGGDYDTFDGTCRRDYIHVMDLAEGHVSAVENIASGISSFNLGTGVPYSVLEIIDAFEKVSGKKIPYQIVARRDGDLPQFWADSDKANKILGWRAKKSLEVMMTDAWRWQMQNPNGYLP